MYQNEINEINEQMLAEFGLRGIEDTLDNRHAFLEGMRQAWIEEPSSSPEKTVYQRALQTEINNINWKIETE